MDDFDFTAWLKTEMKKKNWDPLDLALETGLTKTAVIYYLQGKRMPTLNSFMLMLKAFGQRLVVEDGGKEET